MVRKGGGGGGGWGWGGASSCGRHVLTDHQVEYGSGRGPHRAARTGGICMRGISGGSGLGVSWVFSRFSTRVFGDRRDALIERGLYPQGPKRDSGGFCWQRRSAGVFIGATHSGRVLQGPSPCADVGKFRALTFTRSIPRG